MELVNHTAAAADLGVTENPDSTRSGRLVVKTTWEASSARRVEMVTEDPEPILEKDVSCELGTIPSDRTPLPSERVEVLALTRAYAPRGRAVDAMDVSLSVGDVTRHAHVVGDRAARFVDGRWHFGPPAPFEAMPLTWERATFPDATLWLDETSSIPIPYATLPDPSVDLGGFGQYLGLASGFPRLQLPERAPNVWPGRNEAESGRMGHPECWSPSRPSDPHRMLELRAALQADPSRVSADSRGEAAAKLGGLLGRAHPGWELERVADGAWVRAVGLIDEGEWVFELPRIGVWADYEVASRRGSAALALRRIVLMPDLRRFYLVHTLQFATRVASDDHRSIRLRLES